MIYNQILKGQKIFLRSVEIEDCTEVYFNWLENPLVNKFLETRWTKQDLDMIRSFVSEIRNSQHSYLFAIICNKDYFGKEIHIGNIKLGPIHPHYSYADISYFIGEIDFWGKGIATESIQIIIDFAFNKLNLHRVQAGAFSLNTGSVNALKKAGLIQEGCLRKQLLTNSIWDDHLLFGLLRDEYKNEVVNL